MTQEVLRRLKAIQWDDQKRLLAAGGFATFLLLVALLLPLAFRDADAAQAAEETEREAALRASARANLFAAYWSGDTEGLNVKRLRTPTQQMQGFCESTMAALVRQSINDLAIREVTLSGSEYVAVSDGEAEVKLCRMWQQSTGDWQNWMDVCFDAESGAIYYYYVSRECLTNSRLYELPEEERPSVSSIADGLAATLDVRLRDLRTSSRTEGTAVLANAAGTMVYEISCVYYDVLLDIKLVLV